jgi:hypothetical protein
MTARVILLMLPTMGFGAVRAAPQASHGVEARCRSGPISLSPLACGELRAPSESERCPVGQWATLGLRLINCAFTPNR